MAQFWGFWLKAGLYVVYWRLRLGSTVITCSGPLQGCYKLRFVPVMTHICIPDPHKGCNSLLRAVECNCVFDPDHNCSVCSVCLSCLCVI